MKHFKVTFRPDDRQISIHEGATVLEAAGQADIILNAACGGKGTCGKCLVYIDQISEPVLACQYSIHGDLTVTIPMLSRFYEPKILASAINLSNKFLPDVYRKYTQDQSATGGILGVAIDLGTTTVVAKLLDMTDGRCLATEAALNPQGRFGDDVISRIAYGHLEAGLRQLHRLAIDCINELIGKLCRRASVESRSIYEMCVVGNTTMHHLFLGLPVNSLGQAPYRPVCLEAQDISADKLSLSINPSGNVHTVENIAGFVGSDTTAVALAVDVASADQTTLVVDIGTNGEIILGTADKLYAASCAAGPAFEGARIRCGSRAVEGAIEAVVANIEDIDIDVIGDCVPTSICGSGLLDAAAVMIEMGIIDRTGRFCGRDRLTKTLPAPVLKRILDIDGEPAFCLAFAPVDGEPAVFVTQGDIRQIQLAKGAIRAGVKILQARLGLQDDDIKRVLLAGAFGNYLRPQSAVKIGLLPNIPIERIQFVGNAACGGAEMILLNRQARIATAQLAMKIEYVELASTGDFHTVFAESMLF